MHKNLHPKINENIAQSELDGGVRLGDLSVGDAVLVRTNNTLYTVIKTADREYTIEGNERYCPTPTPCKIPGSTWGGSMLKMDFIGKGMYMEFYVNRKCVTTTRIKHVEIVRARNV